MNLIKKGLILLVLIVLSINVVAGFDAISFVSNETNMLGDDETAKESITVKDKGIEYQVVLVFSGDKLQSMIALDEKKVFVESKSILNRLFKTTLFIKSYSDLKTQINENPSFSWFLNQSIKAKTIASFNDEKKFELDLVANELDSDDSQILINALKGLLDDISEKLLIMSIDFTEASNFETEFLNAPETGREEELSSKIIDSSQEIISIQEIAADYKSRTTLLKAIINESDLELDSKRSLSLLIDLPVDVKTTVIGFWFQSSISLEEKMPALLGSATENSINESTEFLMRIERTKAYDAIYGEDDEIKNKFFEKFGNLASNVVSVKKAADLVFKPENVVLWEEQKVVSDFETQVNQAINYYNKGDYGNAVKTAEKAKKSALKIAETGFHEETPKEPFTELLYQILVGLIVLLLAIFVFAEGRKYLKKKHEEDIS